MLSQIFCYISTTFTKSENRPFTHQRYLSYPGSAVIHLRWNHVTLTASYRFKYTFSASGLLKSLSCYHMHFFFPYQKMVLLIQKGFQFLPKDSALYQPENCSLPSVLLVAPMPSEPQVSGMQSLGRRSVFVSLGSLWLKGQQLLRHSLGKREEMQEQPPLVVQCQTIAKPQDLSGLFSSMKLTVSRSMLLKQTLVRASWEDYQVARAIGVLNYCGVTWSGLADLPKDNQRNHIWTLNSLIRDYKKSSQLLAFFFFFFSF